VKPTDAEAKSIPALAGPDKGSGQPVSRRVGLIGRPVIRRLRDAYLAAGILDPELTDDATHVAAATAARADALVSWNFKHIVRIDKMRAFNRVNLQTGFGLLSIVSPQEVRLDDAT